MALPEYYTCDLSERPLRARLLQALRHFDWVTLEYLTVVVLDEHGRRERNTISVAMAKLCAEQLVDVDRTTKPFRYRIRRSS